MSRSRHKATSNQSNNILLSTFIIFLIVIAICFGIVFYVVFISGSEKTVNTYIEQNNENYEVPVNDDIPIPKPTIAIDNELTPVFTEISASSTREPYQSETQTIEYPPSNAFDNNPSTVWTPETYDIFPWIELSAKTPQSVSGIEIENGYSKNSDLYYQNNRAKEIVVESDTVKYSYTLQDNGSGKTQRLVFPEPIETTKIKITINSCYEGTVYNDLCITQITPY